MNSKILASSLLVPLVSCSSLDERIDYASASSEFLAGRHAYVDDSKLDVRTTKGTGFFVKTIGTNPDEGDSGRFSLIDLYHPIPGVKGLDGVIEVQDIPGVDKPSFRIGAQYFTSKDSLSLYSLATLSPTDDIKNVEFINSFGYSRPIGEDIGFKASLENVSNFSLDGEHNFSITKPRIGFTFGKYFTAGLGSDIPLGEGRIDFDEVNFGPMIQLNWSK